MDHFLLGCQRFLSRWVGLLPECRHIDITAETFQLPGQRSLHIRSRLFAPGRRGDGFARFASCTIADFQVYSKGRLVELAWARIFATKHTLPPF